MEAGGRFGAGGPVNRGAPSILRLAAVCIVAALVGPGAAAAAAPTVGEVWVSSVQPTTARLNAEVDPGGKQSAFHFDFLTKVAYEANVAGSKDPFAGTSRLPATVDTIIPVTTPTTISPNLFGLAPGTAYRYRLVVQNADGTTVGPTRDVRTLPLAAPFALPDGRGWEMVSPVAKNGGQIAPAAEAGGGTTRAAAAGGAVAYASKASFAGGAGAAPFSSYLARRTAAGWSTENVTPAHLSDAYSGAPYEAFSTDLVRALYTNPSRCPTGDPCAAGFRLRDNLTGGLVPSPVDPGRLLAASDGLSRLVFTEAGELNLWSPPGPMQALAPTPPVASDPPFGAVSNDGQRIYYQGADDNLYLREGIATKQVDLAVGGGGSLEDAAPDGATVLYTKAGHLYRYDAASATSQDLTPEGGVLAGSATLAAGRALFASTVPLLASNGERYDNEGLSSGLPEPQVYLHDLGSGTLACVSCNPTHARPLGPSRVPGSPGPHRPRAIAAAGQRVFFDSRDALVSSDVNLNWDVYQWTAPGAPGCSDPDGCVALISSGQANWGTFVDASASGDDAFFLTDRSLVGRDPDSVDLYDARVGGGLPESEPPAGCIGDACQVVPAAVEDPVLTTVLQGPGNPGERYRAYGAKARCPKGKRLRTVKRKGQLVQRCVQVKRGKGKGR